LHRIGCPWCGVRDEAEFAYAGDASVTRPADGAGEAAWLDYVHRRTNPRGWHVEWWQHVGGCRRFVKVVRHTVSHEIAWTGTPAEVQKVPE
jgi:heterotetrameric sarcosine oxidase delta subunit